MRLRRYGRYALPQLSVLCSLGSHYVDTKRAAIVKRCQHDRVYLRVGIGESLLELAFGLDSGILHVLEILRHVLHLVLQASQIRIFFLLSLDHFSF